MYFLLLGLWQEHKFVAPFPRFKVEASIFWVGGLRRDQMEEKDDEKAEKKKKPSAENSLLCGRK